MASWHPTTLSNSGVKVDILKSNTTLIWTLAFERNAIKSRTKNKCWRDTRPKKKWPSAQIMWTILGSIANMVSVWKRLECVLCSRVSPTLNVNPTLFVIPCNFFGGGGLPSDFSSKFQSSMTIFHHKAADKRRYGFWPVDESIHHPLLLLLMKSFIRHVICKVSYKSNRLHVDILWFSYTKLEYIL